MTLLSSERDVRRYGCYCLPTKEEQDTMETKNTKSKEGHLEVREMIAQMKYFLQQNWEEKLRNSP